MSWPASARAQPWCSSIERHPVGLPRALGPLSLEVKEEGRAQPEPGDMEGRGGPTASARTVQA